MNNDYLWDGSGEPDPEVKQLEGALAQFRHQSGSPDFLQRAALPCKSQTVHGVRFPRWAFALSLASATVIILLIAAIGALRWINNSRPISGLAWNVENVSGAPRVESNSLFKKPKIGELVAGETLVTDGHSQATLSISDVGTINVEPNTRLRLLTGAKAHNQFALDHGTIHAFIWAAPGEFAVDTPSAIAVDLGCSYTLHVDESGDGLLRTTLGWVGFKLNGREAFIPAGAVCATRPKIGPGTPYFEDASESFRVALSKFDFVASTPQERSAALDTILAQSRKRDALSLWHLLSRVDSGELGRVYDRLVSFVPPPNGVTREGVLQHDPKMFDLWWNKLDLGDVALWRTWERNWSQNKT